MNVTDRVNAPPVRQTGPLGWRCRDQAFGQDSLPEWPNLAEDGTYAHGAAFTSRALMHSGRQRHQH